MRRRTCAFAGAFCAAAALAVPAALADPPGNGLFREHTSHCEGAPLPGGVYDDA